jgi:hypothetical protein
MARRKMTKKCAVKELVYYLPNPQGLSQTELSRMILILQNRLYIGIGAQTGKVLPEKFVDPEVFLEDMKALLLDFGMMPMEKTF